MGIGRYPGLVADVVSGSSDWRDEVTKRGSHESHHYCSLSRVTIDRWRLVVERGGGFLTERRRRLALQAVWIAQQI